MLNCHWININGMSERDLTFKILYEKMSHLCSVGLVFHAGCRRRRHEGLFVLIVCRLILHLDQGWRRRLDRPGVSMNPFLHQKKKMGKKCIVVVWTSTTRTDVEFDVDFHITAISFYMYEQADVKSKPWSFNTKQSVIMLYVGIHRVL